MFTSFLDSLNFPTLEDTLFPHSCGNNSMNDNDYLGACIACANTFENDDTSSLQIHEPFSPSRYNAFEDITDKSVDTSTLSLTFSINIEMHTSAASVQIDEPLLDSETSPKGEMSVRQDVLYKTVLRSIRKFLI
jgi:hypothetical protein